MVRRITIVSMRSPPKRTTEAVMIQHSYCNLRYGVLHSVDYVCANGHRIHDRFETIYFDDICWG